MNGHKYNLELKALLWLGALMVLPGMAGCGSVFPRAAMDRSSLYPTANPLYPQTITSNRQNVSGSFVPAKFSGVTDANVIQIGFGDEEKASNQESQQPSQKITFDQAVTTTLTADPKIRAA